MKKLFIVLAVASLGFVACNNESTTEVNPDSTTVVPVETPTAGSNDTLTIKADSTIQVDTTVKKDTTKK